MIEMFGRSDCTGCAACVNRCPRHCVTMQADPEGFRYPVVDPKACVECGRCRSVCPAGRQTPSAGETPLAFGAVNKMEDQRQESSSGGVFSVLAAYILDRGGVVFGAAFSEDFKSVSHIAVETREDLALLRGSKYLQSSIENACAQAKQALDRGRPVLFTGTPCQIGGLLAFLGRAYDHLYTQSVVCHGASSPMVWEKYADFREKEAGGTLTGVSFRKKTPSWQTYSLELTFENHRKYTCMASQDMYMRCFLKDLSLRPSCYACQFKGTQDPADISLADFWGIRNVLPEMDDGKGTSLVLVRTEKGKRLLEACKAGIEARPVEYGTAVLENPAAVQSAKRPGKRGRFMEDMGCQPAPQVLRRYSRETPLSKTAARLRRYRSWLRRLWLKYRKH